MKTFLLVSILLVSIASAQTEAPLPDKLKKLQDNYTAAIARATTPIATTYIKELEKMKSDYVRAGDLAAAVAAETLMKESEQSLNSLKGGSTSLANMSERQFKKWLSTVTITEIDSPYKYEYTYVNEVVNSVKPGMTEARTHPTATIEVGKIVVPWTSTTSTIIIDPTLTTAQVIFSSGGTFNARITKRK